MEYDLRLSNASISAVQILHQVAKIFLYETKAGYKFDSIYLLTRYLEGETFRVAVG
jgi:hypothetical protein